MCVLILCFMTPVAAEIDLSSDRVSSTEGDSELTNRSFLPFASKISLIRDISRLPTDRVKLEVLDNEVRQMVRRVTIPNCSWFPRKGNGDL